MADSSIKYIQQKEAGNTPEIEVNIRDLLPRQRNRIIEAVVYRAWIARDPPDTNEKGYRVILLDRQV